MARPRSFDEQRVLDATRDQFWSTGYAGTSMDDVMAATGLGKGSLYGAFGDKHRLYLRVFDDSCADAVDDARASLEGPEAQALERLRAYLLAEAARSARPDPARCGCLLSKGIAELAGSDPAVESRALAAFAAIEESLAATVEQARRHGDIDATADSRTLGSLLLAVVRGIEALGRAGTDAPSLRAIAEAAVDGLPTTS